VDDAGILAATARVVGQVGPGRLTLERVAREVGLAPATLIQRFGSRRGLLLALAKGSRGHTEAFLARLRAAHSSPLTVAREFLLCFAGMATTPREMANHLAFFQMDLTDPAFHRLTLEDGTNNEAILERLLREAAAAGELRSDSPRVRARLLLSLTSGSLLAWAVFRKKSAREWLARDIDAVLAPYLPRRRAARSRGKKGPLKRAPRRLAATRP
jgi:AcrR family transcriptional regulator